MPRKNKKARRRWTRRLVVAGDVSLQPKPARRVRATTEKKPKPEEQMLAALTVAGYPPPAAQFRFHPKRRWQFDFAWPVMKLALEVEGGIFVRGRHVSPAGFVKDCEKYNAATVDGWSVLRIPVAGKTWIEDAVALVVAYIEGKIKCSP